MNEVTLKIGRQMEMTREILALRAELASAKEELSLVKCGEPNHPDRAYAMNSWLKTFGFRVFCELKHSDVGLALSLLQEGDISRGKAAEAIAELLVGNKPPLPALNGNTFGEDDFPSETVAKIRTELAAEKERVSTLTRQRDEMAAALKVAESVIGEAMRAAAAMNLNKAGCFLSAYQMTGRDYPAILEAVKAKARREGAVGMGRRVQELARAGVCIASSRDVSRALEGIEQAVECIILAIERGEVEA